MKIQVLCYKSKITCRNVFSKVKIFLFHIENTELKSLILFSLCTLWDEKIRSFEFVIGKITTLVTD